MTECYIYIYSQYYQQAEATVTLEGTDKLYQAFFLSNGLYTISIAVYSFSSSTTLIVTVCTEDVEINLLKLKPLVEYVT